MLSKEVVPSDKRVCVRHAGVKTLRVHCDIDSCMCWVRVPIRKGKVGGSESHIWSGCMYVLDELRKYAEATGINVESLLSLNR